VYLSRAAARLRDDASRAANADRAAVAGTDGGTKGAADPVPDAAAAEAGAFVAFDAEESAAYDVEAARAYRDAFQKWEACRAREDTCRAIVNRLTGATP
jgi:hypothetical protein